MQVIIAESQDATLRALVMLLESQPCQEVIGKAKNQNDLLAQVKNQRPDLVILDGELPGRDLRQLVSALRELDPRMGLIVLLRETGVERPILEAGADAVVVKGTPPKKLLLAIEAIREREKRN